MTARARRLLGFAVGVLWLCAAGWILVTAATLVGVAIDVDATPVVGWWWTSISVAVVTLIGGRWWPILALSAGVGLALIVQVAVASAAAPAIGSGLDLSVVLIAAPTALAVVGIVGRVLGSTNPSRFGPTAGRLTARQPPRPDDSGTRTVPAYPCGHVRPAQPP